MIAGSTVAGSATRGGMSTLLRAVVAVGAVVALAGGAFAQEKKPETGNQEEIRALLTVDRRGRHRQGHQQPRPQVGTAPFHQVARRQDLRALYGVGGRRRPSPRPTPVGLYLSVAKRGELAPDDRRPGRQGRRQEEEEQEGRGEGAGQPDRCPAPVSLRGRLFHRDAGASGRAASTAATRLCRVARRLRRLRRPEGEARPPARPPRRRSAC